MLSNQDKKKSLHHTLHFYVLALTFPDFKKEKLNSNKYKNVKKMFYLKIVVFSHVRTIQ